MILRSPPSPSSFLLLLLIISSFLPPVLPRRGGTGGMSMGRGSSGARSGGGIFGRGGGGSAPRTGTSGGGGLFGGRAAAPVVPGHGAGGSGGSWLGGAAAGGAMGHGMRQHGTGMGGMGHSGGGGLFGGNRGGNMGGMGMGHQPRYSKSGVGSFVRSNSFKNAIVGAAAGYLTYQAGKALIRHAAGPMYWNSRPYYWGANHYRPSHGQSNMCRMPIQPGDEQFGNVYFEVGKLPPPYPILSAPSLLLYPILQMRLIMISLIFLLPHAIDGRGGGGRGGGRGRSGARGGGMYANPKSQRYRGGQASSPYHGGPGGSSGTYHGGIGGTGGVGGQPYVRKTPSSFYRAGIGSLHSSTLTKASIGLAALPLITRVFGSNVIRECELPLKYGFPNSSALLEVSRKL
ncbi:hypothetical protein PENTCL1PPCAC_10744 [Pristionchus entomophagus]|uniref:CX domain-containing protein n=1 Tax=Pristionchus entomophagus TaxID=358040 RepID=A0AAV5T7M5_9BILA|nr:hypothetical protein PENTCL1PPCAC_10744 [Pristionchus entomophagus]